MENNRIKRLTTKALFVKLNHHSLTQGDTMAKDKVNKVGETVYVRADRTYDLYQGENLWFVEYNREGLYYNIYTGATKEEAFKNFEDGNSALDYSDWVSADDGNFLWEEEVANWMEKMDKRNSK